MDRVYYSLYDRMLSRPKRREAFGKVKAAKGAPGVDGQSIAEFAEEQEKHLIQLARELREKTYRPQAVRRVEIPKPGGGVRKLGIPAVRDRVVQQALLDILQPIFDPHFHPSSYGYRPGRSGHEAIGKVTMFLRDYDLEWAVDMDLSKCFDTLDHDLILRGIRKRVADGSVLHLIRMFLESGVLTDEGWQASEVGSPQGGVISPLIANVYLDEFDHYMKAHNHRLVRYADDIVLLARSRKAAEGAQARATAFLEGPLKLTVNREKTRLVHRSEGVKFLGVIVRSETTGIQDRKIAAFKDKVKKITRRNSPVNLKQVIQDLNPVRRAFAHYFRVANCKGVLETLMKWIRRRLRAKQMALWKKPSRLHRRLRQLEYRGEFEKIRMNSWHNSKSPLVNRALPNRHFTELGLFDMLTVKTGFLVSKEILLRR